MRIGDAHRNIHQAWPERFSSSAPELLATVILTAVYVGWMLWMPMWPSVDGPVHLYYVAVLGKLLTHQSTLYASFYQVKHLAPPYALYYYALLLLAKLVSPLLADRLIICIYFVLFVSGFRRLAREVGPSADRMSLLAMPLLLSWPLGMGFVNYCLAVALALWALSLWFRFAGSHDTGQRLCFLALVALVTLAHPVPLLFVLSAAGLDLVLRLRHAPQNDGIGQKRGLGRDFVTLLLSTLALVYVRSFTVARPLEQRTSFESAGGQRALEHWIGFLQGKSLVLLVGHTLEITAYRVGIVLILVVALLLALVPVARRRTVGRAGAAFLLLTWFLLLGLPWLPSDFSGAYFFTERLTLLLWTVALLAGSAWAPAPTKSFPKRSAFLSGALLTFTGAVSLCQLSAATRILRPIAARQVAMSGTRLPLAGARVLALESEYRTPFSGSGPSWNPDFWSAVHLVRGSDAILANSPWLDSPIIPLAAKSALPGTMLSPQVANSPNLLPYTLQRSSEVRKALLSETDAMLFVPVGGEHAGQLQPLVQASSKDGTMWRCTTDFRLAFTLCARSVQLRPSRGAGPCSGTGPEC